MVAKVRTPEQSAKNVFRKALCWSNVVRLPFNLDFNAHVKDRVLAGSCEVTGIPFDHSVQERGFPLPFEPVIERVDPERGFEPDNIQIVVHIYAAARCSKWRWSEEDVLQFARAMVSRNYMKETRS